MKVSLSENNFDLIRLTAALQVCVMHVLHSLPPPISTSPVLIPMEVLSGVPIFFFISGFLISRSFEKTSSLRDYARNRALRIFPALHVCVLINLLLVAATGYFATVHVHLVDLLALYVAKTTFFQFYNPDFMRGFGDGVLDGSLWTVCVELQFYFLIPVIYKIFVYGKSNRAVNITLLVLIALSLACNRALYLYQGEYATAVGWKLARVSFLPWIYMFLTGMLVQRNFGLASRILRRHSLLIALPLYLVVGFVLVRYFGFRIDNGFSPLLFLPLVAVTLIAAYTAPSLSRKLLAGQDISYGVYIYHAPVMNMFDYYRFTDNLWYVLGTPAITILLALASWFLVERPALSHKRRAARPVSEAVKT
jgi:peptidoglycan/LPS O-acetylase OafA/YrhL